MADLIEGVIADVIGREIASVKNTSIVASNRSGNDPIPEDMEAEFEDDKARFFPSSEDEYSDDFFLDQDGKRSGQSCRKILYQTMGQNSDVRVWDVIILVPNILFFCFLLSRLKKSIERLKATNAPVLEAIHLMVLACSAVSVLRCVVSMSAAAAGEFHKEEASDKIMWLILRAVLLVPEISCLAFALCGGAVLSSKSSVKRVVLLASLASLSFCFVQASLELSHPDPAFHVRSANVHLFGHGGALFWLISSVSFAMVYAFVLLLPIIPCRKYSSLPNKNYFYYYTIFLLVVNLVQAVGCGLLYKRSPTGPYLGMCYINFTSYVYFVLFTPAVYFTFLAQFFFGSTAQPILLFSYKTQTNQLDGDDVSINGHFSLESQPALEDTTTVEGFSLDSNEPIIISSSSFGIQQRTDTNASDNAGR